MAVLFLGPPSPLLAWLRDEIADIRHVEEQIDTAQLVVDPPDIIVSYGYRHRIAREVIEAVQGRAVNLHISYLPWNRGADPNLWSIVDATPIGVTIHYVDEDYDTGDIIAQRLVGIDPRRDTLRTSYAALHSAIQDLFRTSWPVIRDGECARRPQPAGGSFHRTRDGRRLIEALPLGWDTPLCDLAER